MEGTPMTERDLLRSRLEARLRALREEAARGQERLAQAEQEVARLRQALLRISGAVQVLEEELDNPDAAAPADA